jgi:hypothetical protein
VTPRLRRSRLSNGRAPCRHSATHLRDHEIRQRPTLKRVALALAIVSVVDLAYNYLTIGRSLEATDDA